MKDFEILVSCMNEDAVDLVQRSNIRCDCVIVDQCDQACQESIPFEYGTITRVCTVERGLSNSRNMAINHADSEICLISDDDEIFVDDLQESILKAYSEIPDADIIIFRIKNFPTKIKRKVHRMKKLELLRTSSWMISFKLKSVKYKIRFDNKIGSGTGNGGGEEIKFLLDCYKMGLRIYHYPFEIGEVNHQKSQWFEGYNQNYFFQRGATTKYYMGTFWALIYGLYFVVTKYHMYKTKEFGMVDAMKCLLAGIKSGIQ